MIRVRPLNVDLMASHRGWFDEYGTYENDEALTIDSTNVLDISTALWQGLSAAMPMNPLCDPTCKGICARCSAHLNVVNCKCKAESKTIIHSENRFAPKFN